jgi:ubiquinone biosynthesis protein UbiJ
MDENYNMYSSNHTANAERVINNQVEELKTDISNLIFEREKKSNGPNEIEFKKGTVGDLNYKINKLKSQLERLTKEEES